LNIGERYIPRRLLKGASPSSHHVTRDKRKARDVKRQQVKEKGCAPGPASSEKSPLLKGNAQIRVCTYVSNFGGTTFAQASTGQG
jgi:hypothetical protein